MKSSLDAGWDDLSLATCMKMTKYLAESSGGQRENSLEEQLFGNSGVIQLCQSVKASCVTHQWHSIEAGGEEAKRGEKTVKLKELLN